MRKNEVNVAMTGASRRLWGWGRKCRRGRSRTDWSLARRWMWQKGAFWLTASVQADLRCLDLADLEASLWAAALTPHTFPCRGAGGNVATVGVQRGRFRLAPQGRAVVVNECSFTGVQFARQQRSLLLKSYAWVFRGWQCQLLTIGTVRLKKWIINRIWKNENNAK